MTARKYALRDDFEAVIESDTQSLMHDASQVEDGYCVDMHFHKDAGPIKGLVVGKCREKFYVMVAKKNFNGRGAKPADCFTVDEVGSLLTDTYLLNLADLSLSAKAGNLSLLADTPKNKFFGPFTYGETYNFCRALQYANFARNIETRTLNLLQPIIEKFKKEPH